MNLPITGFFEAALAQGHDLVPLIWCSAEPSSYVTTEAFERVTAMLTDGLAEAGPLDALYLDLHGAMVTEDHEDGEGEILRRLRAVTGPDLPVAVSLDLHANVTEAMVARSTAINCANDVGASARARLVSSSNMVSSSAAVGRSAAVTYVASSSTLIWPAPNAPIGSCWKYERVSNRRMRSDNDAGTG